MAEEPAALSRAHFWDAFYSEPRIAEFRRRLYVEAFGDEYTLDEETDGYITRTELSALADALHAGPGHTIADLGCGRGGPGQWVAHTTGASLVGIDISETALEQARARARHRGIKNTLAYKVASLEATGLDTATLDGAMSVDAIWAVPDKHAGFLESVRILKPGGRFVFTDWERDLVPPGYPAPIVDYQPLLRAAGFEVELYQQWPKMDAMRRAFYESMVQHQAEIVQLLDPKRAESVLREARAWIGLLDGTDYMRHSRRVFLAARTVCK